jgi:probable HAF family extracellular repeat protein
MGILSQTISWRNLPSLTLFPIRNTSNSALKSRIFLKDSTPTASMIFPSFLRFGALLTISFIAPHLTLGANVHYVVTDLGLTSGKEPKSGYSSEAAAISNTGVVVGSGVSDTGRGLLQEGFVYKSGFTSYLTVAALQYDSSSQAFGVNASGRLVGTMTSIFGNQTQGFLSDAQGNTGIIVGLLGAAAINDLGEVAGDTTVFGYRQACLATNAGPIMPGGIIFTVTPLGTLGSDPYSFSTGINSSSQIVGVSQSGNGNPSGFLYSGGSLIPLGSLSSGFTSYPTAISDTGLIVGYSPTSQGATHAFLYSGGNMKDLGCLDTKLGGGYSAAFGVNRGGQVVGESFAKEVKGRQILHGFLYTNGKMIDLDSAVNDPAWTIRSARGINDFGQIVVNGVLKANSQIEHALLLTPASLAPRIKVRGPLFRETVNPHPVVRGRASGEVTSMTYQVGEHGVQLKARGTTNWSFQAPTGRAKVFLVRAVGPRGASEPVRITIHRVAP